MTSEFKDIQIVSLSEDLSHSIDSSSLRMDIVLLLSDSPASPWVTYLRESWAANFASLKDGIGISGDRLTIRCTPEELEDTYLEALKNLTSHANLNYRQFLESEKRAQEAKSAKAVEQKAKLAQINKKIQLGGSS